MTFSRFDPLDPDEVDQFTWDFTALVNQVPDDTLASIVSIAADIGDGHLTIGPSIASDSVVTVTLSTPTLGITYGVRVRVLTTFGRVLDLTGTIHCQQN